MIARRQALLTAVLITAWFLTTSFASDRHIYHFESTPSQASVNVKFSFRSGGELAAGAAAEQDATLGCTPTPCEITFGYQYAFMFYTDGGELEDTRLSRPVVAEITKDFVPGETFEHKTKVLSKPWFWRIRARPGLENDEQDEVECPKTGGNILRSWQEKYGELPRAKAGCHHCIPHTDRICIKYYFIPVTNENEAVSGDGCRDYIRLHRNPCFEVTLRRLITVGLDEAFTSVSPLIIMIDATGNDLRNGAGLIVGYDDNHVYAVTAAHVVWDGDRPLTTIQVYLRASGGPVNARALPCHIESSQSNIQRDIAVISFDRNLALKELGSAPFTIVGDTSQLKKGEELYSVGYPNGQEKWHMGPPDHYSALSGSILTFDSDPRSVTLGYSGGPLFNSRFQLIGIIVSDGPYKTNALVIDYVLDALRRWHVPTKLFAGDGWFIYKVFK